MNLARHQCLWVFWAGAPTKSGSPFRFVRLIRFLCSGEDLFAKCWLSSSISRGLSRKILPLTTYSWHQALDGKATATYCGTVAPIISQTAWIKWNMRRGCLPWKMYSVEMRVMRVMHTVKYFPRDCSDYSRFGQDQAPIIRWSEKKKHFSLCKKCRTKGSIRCSETRSIRAIPTPFTVLLIIIEAVDWFESERGRTLLENRWKETVKIKYSDKARE